jgi:hypothetical protein
MANARRRDLVGRKIVGVEFNRKSDGRGGRMTDPVITLDNGRKLLFSVHESDVGEYGVTIILVDKESKL